MPSRLIVTYLNLLTTEVVVVLENVHVAAVFDSVSVCDVVFYNRTDSIRQTGTSYCSSKMSHL